MMDRRSGRPSIPAQAETLIASKLILSYAQYGLVPACVPPR